MQHRTQLESPCISPSSFSLATSWGPGHDGAVNTLVSLRSRGYELQQSHLRP